MVKMALVTQDGRIVRFEVKDKFDAENIVHEIVTNNGYFEYTEQCGFNFIPFHQIRMIASSPQAEEEDNA